MDLAEGLIILLLLPLIISPQFCSSSSSSTDTINFNQSLADGQVLVSNGGRYTLGFFSPGNSSNRYFGIWYTKVPVQTVVWVANRDNPINDTSGLLSIDSRGEVALQRGRTNFTRVWSPNVSAHGNLMAKLLDEGNFVLLQPDGRTIIWQSFDHLTDTIFPNMKFGLDRKIGLHRSVQSWKSPDDPGSGEWTFDWDPNGVPQMMLHNSRTKRWRYVPRTRNTVRDVIYTSNFYSTCLSNDTEAAFAWGTWNPIVESKMYVDSSGFVSLYMWQNQDRRWIEFNSPPKEPCDYYGRCGANGNCDPYTEPVLECSCLPGFEPKFPNQWFIKDGSGGCTRKRSGNSSCMSGGEGFVKLENMKIPDTGTGRLNAGMDLNECRQECLSNCSCTAYASSNLTSGLFGCVTFYEDLMDTRVFNNGGQDLYVRVDAIELAEYTRRKKGHKWKKELLPIIVISLGRAAVGGISIAYCLLKGKRKGSKGGANHISPGIEYDAQKENNVYEDHKDSHVSVFDVNDIIVATENFSSTNKVGQGGFRFCLQGFAT